VKYCRINLNNTNYTELSTLQAKKLIQPEVYISTLKNIYKEYCAYKKFESVMPIFDSEFTDIKNDIIVYYHNNDVVAFSLLRKYDSENIEAIQFAWNYNDPKLRLGIESLKHECAYYKSLGYKYLYLGQTDEYKNEITGYEIL
jgi:hypothetical protein